jgi:hypothetical protein
MIAKKKAGYVPIRFGKRRARLLDSPSPCDRDAFRTCQ